MALEKLFVGCSEAVAVAADSLSPSLSSLLQSGRMEREMASRQPLVPSHPSRAHAQLSP